MYGIVISTGGEKRNLMISDQTFPAIPGDKIVRYDNGNSNYDIYRYAYMTYEEEWNKTYGDGGSGWDAGSSVQQTSDGGYIIASSTLYTYSVGESDVWLIKIPE